MVASAKQRTLVLGHSFLQCFSEFIDNSQPRDLYGLDLQLFHTYEVEIFVIGGCTVDKMICFDMNLIRGTTPNVVVLKTGFKRWLQERLQHRNDHIIASSVNRITAQQMEATIYRVMPDPSKETFTLRGVQ